MEQNTKQLLIKQMENACAEGFKNFLIFRNEKDFLMSIRGEVYGVFDYYGNFVGDFLETDYTELYNEKFIVCPDEFLSYEQTGDKADDYPTDIGNYFVDKNKQDAIPLLKQKRTIIVIVDKLKC